MSNAGFGNGRNSVTEIEEEPEVMMLDFSDKNIYEDMLRQEQKRKEVDLKVREEEQKLKEQKELLQKLGLLELSDSVLYSTHPLTSVKKVEMRLLTTLTHYDLYII